MKPGTQPRRLRLSMAAVMLFIGAARAQDSNPRTVYFSTGDYQDLFVLPMDSQATIEAAFESVHRSYKARRIWWRGGQDEVWGREFVFRPENRSMARLWDWWRDLAYRKVGTNRIAVRAAHDRGMQIWMAYGLFDWGSAADVGYVGFPFPVEFKPRMEHPEWAPVNRFGTWRQGGPLEFHQAAARKAAVESLSRHVIEGGYDGIAFLTYAENNSLRYEDEFGFDPALVDEFKRRSGIDPRNAPFDPEAWARLRGEGLTQFLRELHAVLKPHGRKIAVCVDGENPHLPTPWSVGNDKVRTAGRIHCDLETWIREGLVDEINVQAPVGDAGVNAVADLCRGTSVQCSVFRSRGNLPDGLPRIVFVSADVESGFDYENFIGCPDENIPNQPADALHGRDVFAKRRLFTAALRKRQTVPVSDIAYATKDPDVYVRHLALRTLAALADESTRAAVMAALSDPENSIRCQAALALAQLPGTGTVQTLFAAAARNEATFQFNYRAIPDALRAIQAAGRLSVENREWMVSQAAGPNPRIREAALHALVRVGAPSTPDTEKTLIKLLREDRNPACREMALENLRSSFGPVPAVLPAVREAMQGRDQIVQLRAAVALASMIHSMRPGTEQEKALADVTAFFRQYGRGCPRSDAAWGWRELGNAMLSVGDSGEAVLKQMMTDPTDQRLAERAWRVMYLRQDDQLRRITLGQDQAAHALRPPQP